MFKLDTTIFNYLYIHCKILGGAFNFSAFEGFVMYLGIFTLAGLKGFNKYSDGKKKVVKK